MRASDVSINACTVHKAKAVVNSCMCVPWLFGERQAEVKLVPRGKKLAVLELPSCVRFSLLRSGPKLMQRCRYDNPNAVRRATQPGDLGRLVADFETHMLRSVFPEEPKFGPFGKGAQDH